MIRDGRGKPFRTGQKVVLRLDRLVEAEILNISEVIQPSGGNPQGIKTLILGSTINLAFHPSIAQVNDIFIVEEPPEEKSKLEKPKGLT